MKITDIMESTGTEPTPFEETIPKELWHGTELRKGDYTFKARSKPKDTFMPAHNTVAKLSEQQLGVNIRSLMFASFDKTEAELYGDARILVPLGTDYRLFYVKDNTDMTTGLGFGLNRVRNEITRRIKMSLVTANDLPEQLGDLIRGRINSYHNPEFQGTLDNFFDEIIRFVVETLTKYQTLHFKEERLVHELTLYRELMKERIMWYISNVSEIKSSSEALRLESEEIMVYAPSGFRIKYDY